MTISRTYNRTPNQYGCLKGDKISLINIVADLIRRETQKPFYTKSGTINAAMHDWLLYILLHLREYSGIYFAGGMPANQIHLSYTNIFCNVKRNKVPLSD